MFHDDTLDRMTEGHGLVYKTPWAQVKTLHLAGSGQHPPLLAEALRAVAQADPATPLIVEIKSRRRSATPLPGRAVQA